MSLKYGKNGSIDTAVLDENGEPTFTPALGGSWAEELVGSDGIYRYLSGGVAKGRGVGNVFDAMLADNFTILALMRYEKPSYESHFTKLQTGSSTGWLISNGPQGTTNGLYVRVDNVVGANIGFGSVKETKDLNWHWYGFSMLGLAVRSYLDGAMKSAQTRVAGDLTNNYNFVCNAVASQGIKAAAALIYNRVLTDEEVSNIMLGKVKPTSVAGLQGYYKFNETHGNANGKCTDYSGAGNHLTYSAAVWASFNPASPTKNSSFPYVLPPLRNQANWWERTPIAIASKDAMGSAFLPVASIAVPASATAADAFAPQGDFTVSTWIKPRRVIESISTFWGYAGSTYSGVNIILYLQTSNSNSIRCILGNGTTVQTINIPLGAAAKRIPFNAWSFVVVKREGNEIHAYINGVFVGSAVFTPSVAISTTGAHFINSALLSSHGVRLFHRAISAAEVEQLYRTDSITDRTDLVGEWMMNDVSTNFCANTGSAGSALNSSTFSGGKYLDSPYWMPRRKRRGKQLSGGSAVTVLVGSPLVTAMQGLEEITVSSWGKIHKYVITNLNNIYAVGPDKRLFVDYQNPSSRQGIICRNPSVDAEDFGNTCSNGVFPFESGWHLFSATYNYTTGVMRHYCDGVLVGSTGGYAGAAGGLDLTGVTGLQVVKPDRSGITQQMDDFRLYNRALTADEHYQLYLDNAPRDGLLVEYKFDRRNMLNWSEDFSNAVWLQGNATKTPGQLDPLGGTTACRVTATAGNGYIYQSALTPTGAVRNVSFWVKRVTGTGNVVLGGNTVGEFIISPTTEWQRFDYSFTEIDGNSYISVRLATSGDAVDIAFAQMDIGPVATTYEKREADQVDDTSGNNFHGTPTGISAANYVTSY